MEAYGLELVEQPISGRNLPELAYLRGRLQTPLLANEASWTRYDQLEVIRHGAADVVSVDHQMDGGLLNLKRGAGLCEVAGLPVLKHSLGELGVAQYAALHVIASTSNFLYANQGYGSFLESNVIGDGGALPYSGGALAVPEGPGIGVELNTDAVAAGAERYQRERESFAFHSAEAIARTPAMPKL
jgi:L-alanine-DL-glutamate epimerase-like enolase superfamily enzyme